MDRRVAVVIAGMVYLIIFQAVLTLVRRRRQERRELLLLQLERFRIIKTRQFVQQVIAVLASRPRKKREKQDSASRSKKWWLETVPTWQDNDWLENCRVTKSTFDLICAKVEPVLKPSPNPVMPGRSLSVQNIVAIALYKLAHVAEYKVVGNQFGVHKSTVHNCVYAFCIAVTELLASEYIRMPDEEEAATIAKSFEKICHIPQIIGAIDGSHIPITGPADGHQDFVNKAFYCSLVLQAIVDDQFLFRNITCKNPGSCHDLTVFEDSSFYRNREKLMPKGTKTVNGMQIIYMLVGDPAYPCLPWLMKNYEYNSKMTPEKDSFNAYMNKARIHVEQAFGRLKGRWRILLKRSEIHYTFMPKVVAACCILHNICEMSKDFYCPGWDAAVDSASVEYPEVVNEPNDDGNMPSGTDVRDHLMKYLRDNFDLAESIRGRYAKERQAASA